MKAQLTDTVLYRGKEGLTTMRSAQVTATLDSLDPRGVAAGHVQALDSDGHLHLWVFTPGGSPGFAESNIPHGVPDDGEIPPGSWCWPHEVDIARYRHSEPPVSDDTPSERSPAQI